jgi:hypothetical protein
MTRQLSDKCFADAIGEVIAKTVGPIKRQVAALEQRLADLEARQGIKDCWKEGEYRAGAAVTWGGLFWIAQRNTTTKPNQPDSDWRLAPKRGGRDDDHGQRSPKRQHP